jgi:hypothetical protein
MHRSDSDHSARAGKRMLELRSGGWVLVLMAVLMLAVLCWRLAAIVPNWNQRAIGDGRNVASYGFDLSTCLVQRERIAAARMPRDGLPALVEPPNLSVAGVETLRLGYGPFLTPDDRVIGVRLGGEARAYPLRIVIWHEVVNDTIDDTPLAVTYNPLCDAAVVFDRRVGGRTCTFGVSGLLYNSNLLLYDRQEADGASLWSQLLLRAVAGPAAQRGEALRPLPMRMLRWAEWRAMHPGTRVLAPDPVRKRLYRREAYSTYFASPRLEFPVTPLPPGPPSEYKLPCLAVPEGGAWRAIPLATIARRAGADGSWTTVVDGRRLRFEYRGSPPTAWVSDADSGEAVECAYAFRFAWYAIQGPEALDGAEEASP